MDYAFGFFYSFIWWQPTIIVEGDNYNISLANKWIYINKVHIATA